MSADKNKHAETSVNESGKCTTRCMAAQSGRRLVTRAGMAIVLQLLCVRCLI